jgi:hypothetical protein
MGSWKTKVVDFIDENYDTIEKDMNNRNSTSKRKEAIVDNSKTQKEARGTICFRYKEY